MTNTVSYLAIEIRAASGVVANLHSMITAASWSLMGVVHCPDLCSVPVRGVVQTTTLQLQINQDSHLGYNCIQNFNLGRYIVGYTVGN